MSTSKIQRSFVAGEIAPALYGRADSIKYQTGLRTCRNFFVMRHGGVANRTGSQFIAAVKDSTRATYFLKFVFNDEQSYLIEAGEGYFRFYRNAARIVVSGVAAYSGATAYVPGDLVESGGTNYHCIAATTGNAPPNATYWYALDGDIFEIPTPYATADLSTLQFVQSGDVVTIVHPNYDPYELSRTDHTAWTLTVVSFAPSIAAPGGPPAAANGSAGSTVFRYKVTSVKVETYEESLPTAVFICTGGDPTSAAPNVLSWTAVSGAAEYNVYREHTPGNGVYGFIGVAAANAFNDVGFIPDASSTPPISRDPFSGADNRPSTAAYWQQRLVLANSSSDPERVQASRSGQFKNFTIHSPIQDDDAVNFVVAGRQVNAVRHLLEIGQLVILTSGGEWTVEGDADGVLKPTAINLRQHSHYGAAQLRPIVIGNTALYMQARGRIIRDLRFQFDSDGYRGNDLTVFSPHFFDRYGIARWDFAQVPQSIVWAVRSDGILLGLTYMPDSGVWGWHRHDSGVEDDPLTTFPGPAFDRYEDVCVVPEGDIDAVYVIVNRGAGRRCIERFAPRLVTDIRLDALFVDSFLSYNGVNTSGTTMTLTSAGGGWTVDDEITVTANASLFTAGDVGNAIVLLDSNRDEITRVIVGTYVSGMVVRGYPEATVPASVQGVARTAWSRAVDQFSGLDHLEGRTVSILADANVLDQQTVVSGEIALGRPYSIVHVGLPLTADMETLELDDAQLQIRDKKKKIKSLSIMIDTSRGIFAGPDADHLDELKPEFPDDYGAAIAVRTGLVDLPITATWEESGRVLIRQSDPLPLAVMAVIPTGDIGG